MSAGFDGSGYRQRVLATLQARSPLLLDDPFLVADLDPTLALPDEALDAHLGAVMAFLQRERNSAKYKTLAADLIRRRAEWEGVLRDPARRAQAAAAALAARSAGDAERYAKVDGYLATVRDRFGGIPRSRVDGLRRLAGAAGVPAAEFDARLVRERVIDDTAGGVEPLADGVRRQIRDQLAELARLRDGDRAGTASLWAFLGVPPDADTARVRAAYEALGERNQRRPHDREKTVTADLLAQVRTRLIDADPAAYSAGLVADARDAVRPRITEHVLLDDGLSAVATEGLVREVLEFGWGLSASQARAIVLDVARELGAAVSTGRHVDYVVCPACGRPEPVDGSRVCRYCDTGLYLDCPACGRSTDAAAVVCRNCGQNVRQAAEAAEAVTRVRHALATGRPREAADLLVSCHPILTSAGGAPAARAADLKPRVQAALSAATAGWRALSEDIAAHRIEAAIAGARWLASQAADVVGPDGQLPAAVLAELTSLSGVVRRRVEAALALPMPAREEALAGVLRTAADDRGALAALAALPLSPPTDLSSTESGGVVFLRWTPPPSSAPVSYRVVRVVDDPSLSGGRHERSLGTIPGTELSDAGVPGGVLVHHEVTALAGGRRSEAARTVPMLVVRDIDGLRAEMISDAVSGDGVALTWRLDAARDDVVIERTMDASSPISGPPRRINASGGRYLDTQVQAGATYRYRVRVEYVSPSGSVLPTEGLEVVVTATARPRMVGDLKVETRVAESGPGGSPDGPGETLLRWTVVPGAVVRVYASSWQSGPLGAPGEEIAETAMDGRARLVGESRRGRLVDHAAAGEMIYTPVSVTGDRAVIGQPVGYAVVEGVRDLRAIDRGDEIVLSFLMPAGVTEARVLWRRDVPPTGPEDPLAASAKVTNTSLEIKGGWHLPAPPDGWAYHLAVYPLVRTADGVQALHAPARVLARPATRPDAPPPPARVTAVPPAGPVRVTIPTGGTGTGGSGTGGTGVAGQSGVTVSYRLTRPGLMRRTLRVEVRADGPLPDMVLVARAGAVPPRTTRDGYAVATVPASPPTPLRSVDIPLVDAQLPWAVRLLPAHDVLVPGLDLRHPMDEELVVH